jgi:hypothetical protein
MKHLRQILVPIALVLLACAAASAQIQVMKKGQVTPQSPATKIRGPISAKVDALEPRDRRHELRCRGVANGFLIDNLGPKEQAPGGGAIVTLQLNFLPSPRAPREDGSGMEPGKCSFVDRVLYFDEPVRVQFETPANAQLNRELSGGVVDNSSTAAEKYPDARTIPVYLKNPEHHWSFFVVKTNDGYFKATGHQPYKTFRQQRVIGGDNVDLSKLTIRRLTDVRVYPDIGGVGFRFIARPNAAPVVEIDKEPPAIGRDGLPVFRNSHRMRADRDNRNSNSVATIYVGSSKAQGIRLEQGTLYHYIITVPGEGSTPTYYDTSSFTTLGQTVKVLFTTVNILDDGNDNEDLIFNDFIFYVNPGEPTAQSLKASPRGAGRRRIGGELVIANAPDRLTIRVDGKGYRTSINQAAGTFDLTEYQFRGKNPNVPFWFRSPLIKGGFVFEVTGSIEIIRP